MSPTLPFDHGCVPGPLDAVVEVLGLARREMVDDAGRAAAAAGVDAHAGIVVRHPFLGVDHLPVLVLVRRAGGDVGMLLDHALPGAGIAVLEGEALGVGAVAEDHRIAAGLRPAGTRRRAGRGRRPSRSARPSRCACRRAPRCAADGIWAGVQPGRFALSSKAMMPSLLIAVPISETPPRPRPEEPGEAGRLEGRPQAAACGAILRDAVLRTAPQDEVSGRRRHGSKFFAGG